MANSWETTSPRGQERNRILIFHELRAPASWLADYGLGTTDEQPEDVLTAIESTLQVLFWPTAATDYAVPAPFWQTLIGHMLARAKRRALAAEGLIGVAAATVDRWTAERLGWKGLTVNG